MIDMKAFSRPLLRIADCGLRISCSRSHAFDAKAGGQTRRQQEDCGINWQRSCPPTCDKEIRNPKSAIRNSQSEGAVSTHHTVHP